MTLNIISDREKIKGVLKENKCPYCDKHTVEQQLAASSGTGSVVQGGKYPDTQFVNYKCKNCEKLFKIPINALKDTS